MSSLAPRPAPAAASLRSALDTTADALAVPNLEVLLNVESALTAALAALPTIRSLDADGRAQAREDLNAARAALARCQRLGTSLGEFIRMSLDAQERGVGYGAARGAATTLSGRGFQTRA